MDNNAVFQRAIALREQGKHSEAAQLFLDLARSYDNPFEKAGMLLNVVHALKGAGRIDTARSQLDDVRQLLSLPLGAALDEADEENRRRLLIGVELEDARISASQGNLQDAMARLNCILRDYELPLLKTGFADIYQAIQRDRAFLLTDLGSCQEALFLLEMVDSADPHDRWTLFYLGYCYFCIRKYSEAQQKLEEAIEMGLTPDFEGRARCALGASCYELGDYARAKSELESGVKTASARYIREAGIWRWLEYACTRLGLRAEAEHYARLARFS